MSSHLHDLIYGGTTAASSTTNHPDDPPSVAASRRNARRRTQQQQQSQHLLPPKPPDMHNDKKKNGKNDTDWIEEEQQNDDNALLSVEHHNDNPHPLERSMEENIPETRLHRRCRQLNWIYTNSLPATTIAHGQTMMTDEESKVDGSSNTKTLMPLSNALFYPIAIPYHRPRLSTATSSSRHHDPTKQDQQDISVEEETTTMKMKRIRQERIQEWESIRRRWKNRRYNYNFEMDIGGAMMEQNHHVRLETTVHNDPNNYNNSNRKKRPRCNDSDDDDDGDEGSKDSQESESESSFSNEDDDDDVVMEDSVQQLWRLSQQSREWQEEAKRQKQQQQYQEPKPYAETLTPYEYGRIPRYDTHTSLRQKFEQHRRGQQQQQSFNDDNKTTNSVPHLETSSSPGENEDAQDALFTIPRFDRRRRNTRAIVHREFPFFHGPADAATVSHGFMHRRQLLRLAARTMIGSSSTSLINDGETHARFIRLLWKLNHRQVFAASSVLTPKNARVRPWSTPLLLIENHSRLLGERMWIFLHHRFDSTASIGGDGKSKNQTNDRTRVFQKLIGDLEQELCVGYTMDASMNRRPFDQLTQWLSTTSSANKYDSRTKFFSKTNTISKAGKEKKDMTSSSQVEILDQHFCATTTYMAIPMTVPPAPSMPLDVIGIIFGPMDRYEHVEHGAEIEECVYKLSIASLIARVTESRFLSLKNNNNRNDQHQQFQQLHDRLKAQLHAVLDQMVRLNQSNIHIRMRQQLGMQNLEVPLAYMYKSLMEYCGVVANGIPSPISQHDKISNLLLYAHDDETNERQWKTTPKQIIDNLLQLLEPLINHNGLQIFTDLQRFFGVLSIANLLPESAIELLFHTSDQEKSTTEFDVIRLILEHLEKSNNFVEASPSTEDKSLLNVVEFEYLLYRTAEIFSRCVNRNPFEVSNHCWYISSLAGCLLLCSGNRIGSGARMYPSALEDMADGAQNAFQSKSLHRNDTELSTDHEERRMLPKFQEVRMETINAFKTLVELSKYQNSSRAYFAVAKFLEWQQVVALLFDGSNDDLITDFCTNICALHKYHTDKWAQEENSEFSRSIQLCNHESRIEGLACAIETSPHILGNWTAIISEIGPINLQEAIGTLSSTNPEMLCDESSALSYKHKVNSNGWAAKRLWWKDTLLRIECPNSRILQFIDSLNKYSACENLCMAIDAAFFGLERLDVQTLHHFDTSTTDDIFSLDWMRLEVDKSTNISVDCRRRSCDHILPKAFLASNTTSLANNESLVPKLELASSGANFLEISCYKAILLCHLEGGTMHPDIETFVFGLVAECWDGKMLHCDTDAWVCLRWLHMMGINVVEITTDVLILLSQRFEEKKRTWVRSVQEGLVRITGKDGSLKNASGKNRQDHCFICHKKYVKTFTCYCCSTCGMPLCRKDRRDPQKGRLVTCFEEHTTAAVDDPFGCNGPFQKHRRKLPADAFAFRSAKKKKT